MSFHQFLRTKSPLQLALIPDQLQTKISETNQILDESNEGTSSLNCTPQQLASIMYEYLVQRGCPDLKSSIDPHGFSTRAVAEGGFSEIWSGRSHDGTKLAIKVLRFTVVADDIANKQVKRAAREVYHWSRLEHENIHKLMGVIMFQDRLAMVSSWMEYGNLRQYLRQNSTVDRYQLCVQIAEGVVYLHGIDMVHGDLKACNILVSSDGVLKLTDFDYSMVSDCTSVFPTTGHIGGGSLRWMAPELLINENPPRRNKNTDVYALGMTFLETVTSSHPYSECQHESQVLFKVLHKEYPPRSAEHFPDVERNNQIWNLLVQCWNHDSAARPTARDVLTTLMAHET